VDFNGDKLLDLVVANSGSNTISVLLGNGRGGFAAAVDFPVGLGPASIAMADFNGDLKLDLAVANSLGTTGNVLLGDGLGGFKSVADIPVGTASYSVAAADFNGDLQTDLIIVGLGADVALGPVIVLQGDGTGGFTPVYSLNDIGPAAVAVADFDGDHLPDAVIAKQSGADAILWNQSR